MQLFSNFVKAQTVYFLWLIQNKSRILIGFLFQLILECFFNFDTSWICHIIGMKIKSLSANFFSFESTYFYLWYIQLKFVNHNLVRLAYNFVAKIQTYHSEYHKKIWNNDFRKMPQYNGMKTILKLHLNFYKTSRYFFFFFFS